MHAVKDSAETMGTLLRTEIVSHDASNFVLPKNCVQMKIHAQIITVIDFLHPAAQTQSLNFRSISMNSTNCGFI